MNKKREHTGPRLSWKVLLAMGLVLLMPCATAGHAADTEIPAPENGEFVIRVETHPGTGYVVGLKQMSEGIYFLRTDPSRSGASHLRSFYFFNTMEEGQAGSVVFARFHPRVPTTYTEEQYVVRTSHVPVPRPRLLGVYVVPYQGGLGVVSVTPGSIADVLGVQRRDLLIRVNGQRVATLSDLHEAMDLAPEDQVWVRLRRHGVYLDLRMSDWPLPPHRPTPPHPPYPPPRL